MKERSNKMKGRSNKMRKIFFSKRMGTAFDKLKNDETGAIALIVGVVLAVFGVIFVAMIWWALANLVTVGQGLVYIALAVCMIIATAVLSMAAYKRWVEPQGVGG